MTKLKLVSKDYSDNEEEIDILGLSEDECSLNFGSYPIESFLISKDEKHDKCQTIGKDPFYKISMDHNEESDSCSLSRYNSTIVSDSEIDENSKLTEVVSNKHSDFLVCNSDEDITSIVRDLRERELWEQHERKNYEQTHKRFRRVSRGNGLIEAVGAHCK